MSTILAARLGTPYLPPVTFVPASPSTPGVVVVAGTVAVSNFPASQAVTGPLTAAELLTMEPLAVTGPLTAAQLIAAEPLSVSGPLTDAQLAARLPLSVSGPLTNAELRAQDVDVLGPLTADELDDAGLATEHTVSDIALTAILERDALAVK